MSTPTPAFEATESLLAILKNLRRHRPVLEDYDCHDGEVHVKFKSSTTKGVNPLTVTYCVSKEQYEQISWVYINGEMGYNVTVVD